MPSLEVCLPGLSKSTFDSFMNDCTRKDFTRASGVNVVVLTSNPRVAAKKKAQLKRQKKARKR